MLLRQNGRRDEDRGLFAVEHALHHRAQGDLGLAHAHVAAEQAVHRHGGFHVALDLLGAAELILGLGIAEVFLKLLLPLAVRRKGIARQTLPLGIQADELVGHVLGGALGARAGLRPLRAAHLRQAHLAVLAAAGIFGDEIQLGGRDVQAVRAGVLDLDIVLVKAVDLHLHDAGKAADAVVFVHDIVAHGEVGIALDAHAPGGESFLCALLPRRAQQLRVRQHGETDRGVFHARRDRADRDIARAFVRHARQAFKERGGDAAGGEKLLQHLGAPLVAREDDDAIVLLQIRRHVVGRGLGVAGIGRQLLGSDGGQRARRKRAAPHGKGVGHIDGEVGKPAQQLVKAQ